MGKPPDARIDHLGTICILQPLTPGGREWANGHVAYESWQVMGGGIAVEPGMVAMIVEGMTEAGLMVEE